MIKLLVAEGHPVVREGLRRIVNECPDMMVVAEAADGNGLLAALGAADVDVVLLDIAMPGPGFLDVLAQLRLQHPKLAVLILSVYPEEQYAVRAIKAGAAGYLRKDSSPDRLAEAIRRSLTAGNTSAARSPECVGSIRAGGDDRVASTGSLPAGRASTGFQFLLAKHLSSSGPFGNTILLSSSAYSSSVSSWRISRRSSG